MWYILAALALAALAAWVYISIGYRRAELPDVWELAPGDTTYLVGAHGEISELTWIGTEVQKEARSIGNIYLTREAAQAEVSRRKLALAMSRDTWRWR